VINVYLIAVLELEDKDNSSAVEEDLEEFLLKQLEDNGRVAAYSIRRDSDETLPENLRELAEEIETSIGEDID
jgi:hypothetical protein